MRQNKTGRKLSEETKKKISEARRARTKQPRSGQSKKRQSMYQELKHDYKGNKEALKWIEENKALMDGTGHEFEIGPDGKKIEIDNPGDHQAREFGISTEYSEMYKSFYEFRLASVIFGKKVGDDEEVAPEQEEDEEPEDIEAVEQFFGATEDDNSDDEE